MFVFVCQDSESAKRPDTQCRGGEWWWRNDSVTPVVGVVGVSSLLLLLLLWLSLWDGSVCRCCVCVCVVVSVSRPEGPGAALNLGQPIPHTYRDGQAKPGDLLLNWRRKRVSVS